MAKEELKEPPIKKFKKYVARPGRYGVVVIPHNFVPVKDMDRDTGEWEGVVPEE